MAIIHARLPWEGHGVASFAARWLMATRRAGAPFATATAPIRWTDIARGPARWKRAGRIPAPRHLRAATFGLLGAFAIS
jgi:hypothetical protein